MHHGSETRKQIRGGKFDWDLSSSRGKPPVVFHRCHDVEFDSLKTFGRLAFDEDSSEHLLDEPNIAGVGQEQEDKSIDLRRERVEVRIDDSGDLPSGLG